MAENSSEFKPYIPADKITPEFTITSILTGIILAIVFGAANAYLGLRVGMTISASIPAAVIAMGITRIIFKKNSILESNMVQTIGSAGESVAAGAIFTMPALFLWAKEGLINQPSLLSISLITLCGAILGVLFMIPLRNSIIVQEHGILPYPEAQACAEVLLAGEKKGSDAKAVFSGMAIATLLISTILLKVSGDTGAHGMVSAITIGSIICVIAAIAGDTSQDLKTGYILGATPKKQQIGELVGAIISALTIGGVLILLDSAWGFGSKELAAPQATLMKLVTEGVMNGNLPWSYVFIGAACTVLFELLGLPSLAVAIGIYLPIELTAPIMLGGVLRRLMDKKNKTQSSESSKGVLFCSGLIAGEGLMGVLLAILTVAGIADKIGLGANIPAGVRLAGSVILLVVLVTLIVCHNCSAKNEKAE